MEYKEELKMLLESKSSQQKQEDILIEEMAELTKALVKYRRKPTKENYINIIKELVDVEVSIMCVKSFHLTNKEISKIYFAHSHHKEQYTTKCLKGETI